MVDVLGCSALVDKLPLGICVLDREFNIRYWNSFFADRMDIPVEQAAGQNILELFKDEARFLKKKLNSVFVLNNPSFSYWQHRPHIFKFKSSRPITGEETMMYQNMEIVPLDIENGEVQSICLILHDVTALAGYFNAQKALSEQLETEHAEQRALIKKLEMAQGQLLQAEKMASIGQLAAGVAHEINNPIGFINSNLQSLQDYVGNLIKIIEFTEKVIDKSASTTYKQLKSDFLERQQYAFIKEDIIDLVNESLEGAERVAAIVRNLKSFSHVDNSDWQYSDLTEGMENTLKIVSNQLKYKVEVHRDYDANLPEIYCQPMQLNQVFMNLLVNSAQAIDEKGDIYVSVKRCEDGVVVSIRDTGSGIEKKHLDKIFDPFFTTKPVGSGTGLGLSLSYSIVQKHEGEMKVTSEKGVGTTFDIYLPFLTEAHVIEREKKASLAAMTSS
ncbi:PAS domain-containing protein [Shewanella avicenniae]|uniref:histidine kinase n=1 Tax=Shewanella avicenniae TaxID=2814294 RepID=A0ABX7QR53_9GAMM|nr:ATP-binding protein [Shewanella avicenniae]QSX33185.1 PAS domain-containing protein [Shewanella avicenniae]